MTENKSTDRNKNSDDDLKQIITRVGFLTRMLRESMRELGLEKGVQQAVATIPDGKDSLHRRRKKHSTASMLSSRCR